MTLSLRQYQRVYDRFLLEFLREGKVPTFDEVLVRAGDELPDPSKPIAPIYQFTPQTKRAVFDILNHNRSVRNIKTDLELLFDELNQIQLQNITRIINADLFEHVHSHELNVLTKQLDALLFALEGADDSFFARFESFDDLTKIDLDKSTPGIVDTHEGALALPIGLAGTFKIPLEHLSSLNNTPITISDSAATNLGNIPGTRFGNIFADSTNAWGVTIESPNGGPLEVEFTFRLAREEFINRMTLLHHGPNQQRAIIATSVDNANRDLILEYSEGVLLSQQADLVSLDFDDKLVDFVHVTLAKDTPDSFDSDRNIHTYTFGLRNISIYTTGRAREGTYVSKAFEFDEVDSVGLVGISANELLPDNTSVDWSVGIVDENDQVVGSFMPITPQSRNVSSGPPKTVSIQDIIENQKIFRSTDDSFTNILSFNNIDFYKVTTIDTPPVFGSAFLFRGIRSWLRDQSEAVNPVLVKDNYIPFSKGDTQSLYKIRQEVAPANTITNDAGEVQTVVVVANPPLYDQAKGHSLIPGEGIDPGQDTQPNYAVLLAQLSNAPLTAIKAGQDFSAANPVDLGVKNILYNTAGDIEVKDESIERIFLDGTDYIVEFTDGFPTGRIRALPDSDLLGYTDDEGVDHQPIVSITYKIDPDISRFISSIANSQIYFDFDISTLGLTQAVIKYRFVTPKVIKSSVKAKKLFGTVNSSDIFVQGVDYIFDERTSTIQRLTTGSIDPGQDIYLDYKFNDISDQLEQFFVWAHVDDLDGVNIVTARKRSTDLSVQSTLDPETDRGEELFVSIPGVGLVNLNKAVEWPKLTGWVQFVVKSIPPEEDLEGSREPLIHQVIKLKDEDGDFIFVQGGKYFSDLTAIREPLNQVGFQFLKTNVLKNDDRFFAVRTVNLTPDITENQVIVNFKPNESEKLYQYSPIPDVVGETGVLSIYPIKEEWKVVWSNRETTVGSFNKVVVRAMLTRTAEAGGNVTPKVFDYFVKAGF